MAKRVYAFRCPCCKERLEFDPDSRKARQVKTPGGGLDELVEKHKTESDRLANQFDSASQDAAREKDKLDQAFRDAFKKAKDDKDKPPHPFENE